MNFESKLAPIKADASFRKFYRKKIKKKSSIIVYAEKEKIQNLLNYDSVNKLLLQKNINAPRLLSENFNQNLIEIDDLGTKTILDILKKKNTNKLKIYKKILVILIKLQKIKLKKIKNFKKKFYKIPIYSNKLIFNEANLFLDWYIPKIINNNEKFKVSEKERTTEMTILNSRSESRRGLWDPFKENFKKLEPIGSVAYKMGLTAIGKADVFATLRPKNEWDVCAGVCLINEAGGKAINLKNGQELNFNNEKTLIEPGIIAGYNLSVDKTFKVLSQK